MAHVESTEGVKAALQAGVDTIEHGAPMTPEILDLYRGAAGTQLEGRAPSVTCTISPALPFVLLDPEKTHSTDTQKKNGDIVCSGIIESARAALDAGVKVGLGTDSSCPFVTQYDHVARGGVLCQVRRREQCLCAAHGHAGQCRAAGPGRRDRHDRVRQGGRHFGDARESSG